MSLWYDVRQKKYASDSKNEWVRAYAERIVNALRNELQAKLTAHYSGGANRHTAADIDCADGSTVQSALYDAANARENAYAALSTRVDAEADSRESADTQLQSRINAEAAARQSADENLGGLINAEAAARQSADENLDSRIDAEAAAREAADENLGSLIDAEAAVRQSALAEKVDKVEGKELSSNDYTNEEKSKLAGIEAGAEVNTVASVAGKTGEITLTKTDVGLGNVDNTSDLDKPISTAVQEALTALGESKVSSQQDTTYAGMVLGIGEDGSVLPVAMSADGVTLNKAAVGLGNVDNTSDLDKPISTAVQEALTALGESKVSSQQDAIYAGMVLGIGEDGSVLPVAAATGGVALDKTDVGLGNVDNTSDMDKPISTAVQEALTALGECKVSSQQDAVYAGMVLGIGEDGSVLPVAAATGSRQTEQQLAEKLDELEFLISKAVDIDQLETQYETKFIFTAQQLNDIRNDIDGNYSLAKNIDLSGVDWVPVGTEAEPFTGQLNGNGFTIKNLTVSETINNSTGNYGYAGLFGANAGTISCLRLENVSVTASEGTRINAAAVAGVNMADGIIRETAVASGTVALSGSNGSGVAGIAGSNYGLIKDCYNKADITSESGYTAGIAGYNRSNGSIENTYSYARINSSNYFAGAVYATINNASTANSYSLLPTPAVSESHSNSNIVGATALNLANMQNQSSYTDWDFDNIWTIENGQLPTLAIMRTADADISESNVPDGSAEKPYEITDVIELNGVRNDLGANYILKSDIYMTSMPSFVPIGTEDSPFTGKFDGNAHHIYEYDITKSVEGSDGVYAGLFAFNDGELTNINITLNSTNIPNENAYVGALAGVNMEHGVISRSNTNASGGENTSGGRIGGLVGLNNGRIENSYNRMAVSGVVAGGIVGENNGEVEFTYSTGIATTTATATNDTDTTDTTEGTVGVRGGIAGINNNIVTHSHSTVTSGSVVGSGNEATVSSTQSLTRLKYKTTYVDWDFETVWKDMTTKTAYPTLRRTSV